MVPLRDNNPTTITPFVTYGIIIANIVVFLYQLSLTPQQLQEFFRIAALVPCQLSTTCPSSKRKFTDTRMDDFDYISISALENSKLQYEMNSLP